MSNTITPTVGRRVWYWPTEDELRSEMGYCTEDQPFDAGVLWVDPKTNRVNLSITDHVGRIHCRRWVPIVNADAEKVPGSAQWMPYQQAQAKLGPAQSGGVMLQQQGTAA